MLSPNAVIISDRLRQVYWANRPSELPIRHISFIEDYDMFLQSVVDWMYRRRQGQCQRWKVLAMNVIRAASDVFGGVGKYMVQELFFMAGMFSVRLHHLHVHHSAICVPLFSPSFPSLRVSPVRCLQFTFCQFAFFTFVFRVLLHSRQHNADKLRHPIFTVVLRS